MFEVIAKFFAMRHRQKLCWFDRYDWHHAWHHTDAPSTHTVCDYSRTGSCYDSWF